MLGGGEESTPGGLLVMSRLLASNSRSSTTVCITKVAMTMPTIIKHRQQGTAHRAADLRRRLSPWMSFFSAPVALVSAFLNSRGAPPVKKDRSRCTTRGANRNS